jgi:rubrerythrin
MLAQFPIDLEKVSKENIDKEVLRLGIIAELDAISLYEQLAENASDERIKEVLLDVANEEKEHVGEFKTLLNELDEDQVKFEEKGAEEVEEMLGKK